MATPNRFSLAIAALTCVAGGALWYCGGTPDEPSTTTSTSAEEPMNAEHNTGLGRVSPAPVPAAHFTGTQTPDAAAKTTPMLAHPPGPHLPQPPCGPCPGGGPIAPIAPPIAPETR